MFAFPFYSRSRSLTSTSIQDTYSSYSITSSSSILPANIPSTLPQVTTTWYYILTSDSPDEKNKKVNGDILSFDEVMKKLLVPINTRNFPKYRLLVKEDDKGNQECIIEFALAGYKKENIDVSLRKDEEVPQLFVTVSDSERFYDGFVEIDGNMKQSKVVFGFNLPKYMDIVSAKFEDGLLIVKLKMNVPEDKRHIKVVVE